MPYEFVCVLHSTYICMNEPIYLCFWLQIYVYHEVQKLCLFYEYFPLTSYYLWCNIPGTIRHSLQDKLSKAIQMSSSGKRQPEEIQLKLRSSTGIIFIRMYMWMETVFRNQNFLHSLLNFIQIYFCQSKLVYDVSSICFVYKITYLAFWH